MRAINHSLTGALIGLTVVTPVALPLAVVSHFVCDMIPHFGFSKEFEDGGADRIFKLLLIIDALLCFGLVVILAVIRPYHWLVACICAFLAAAPDFLWINKFLAVNSGKQYTASAFSKWAKDIQWFEKPSGAFVEIAWFIGTSILLAAILRR